MRRVKAVAAALVVASAIAAPALGGENRGGAVKCAAHKAMVQLLTKKYSETPMGVGTVNQDRFMQLFVSERGSWTILVTKTNGESCIVAAGKNWEEVPADFRALDPAA